MIVPIVFISFHLITFLFLVSDETADLSKQSLKKLNRPSSGDALHIKTLILDDNELQRWDNIECYPNISSVL